MRRLLMSLLVLGLGVPMGRADDKPAAKADPAAKALESLAQEFVTAQQKFVEQVKASAEAAKKSGSSRDRSASKTAPRWISRRASSLSPRKTPGSTGFQAIWRPSIPVAVPRVRREPGPKP